MMAMRSSVACASLPPAAVDAQGSAAVVAFVPIINGFAAMAGSAGWMISGASYVPGQLQLMGSPMLEALITRYWALSLAVMAHCRSCAAAVRGLARNHAGSPVASERIP